MSTSRDTTNYVIPADSLPAPKPAMAVHPSPNFDVTPRTVRVEQLAPNPLNRRDLAQDDPRVAQIRDSMAKHGQIQPCPVVTRAAFLSIFPEYESKIEQATHVQVGGACRRAAAVDLGILTLDVIVKDALAADRAEFIAATAAENMDRADLDPIEEARQVELLVGECGSGKAAAERLGKKESWVTERRKLITLAPMVQDALRDRRAPLPPRAVRNWHKLSEEEQLQRLSAWREAVGDRDEFAEANRINSVNQVESSTSESEFAEANRTNSHELDIPGPPLRFRIEGTEEYCRLALLALEESPAIVVWRPSKWRPERGSLTKGRVSVEATLNARWAGRRATPDVQEVSES